MALSGKYDFKGIKKVGAAGLRLALSSSPSTSWMLTAGPLFDLLLEFAANWLANKGLVILNLGAITIKGEIDQGTFDAGMDKAIAEIKAKGGRESLTTAQKKAIDDEVIKAARQFVLLTRPE